jgi:hypothetical protein
MISIEIMGGFYLWPPNDGGDDSKSPYFIRA